MAGYTLNGVAGRIRDLETKVGGAYYVALCWLAMNRNSGKGARKLLETKIFGDAKPTSTFRNAWRVAEKSFSEGFHAECRKTVVDFELDDAVKYAVDRLEAHKAALHVTSMKDYEDVCKYASVEVIPAAAASEAEGEQEEAKQPEGEQPPAGNAPPPEVDVLENMRNAAAQLTLEQAKQFAGWLSDFINAAEAAAQAKPEGEAKPADFDPVAELAKAKAEGEAKRKAA